MQCFVAYSLFFVSQISSALGKTNKRVISRTTSGQGISVATVDDDEVTLETQIHELTLKDFIIYGVMGVVAIIVFIAAMTCLCLRR